MREEWKPSRSKTTSERFAEAYGFRVVHLETLDVGSVPNYYPRIYDSIKEALEHALLGNTARGIGIKKARMRGFCFRSYVERDIGADEIDAILGAHSAEATKESTNPR